MLRTLNQRQQSLIGNEVHVTGFRWLPAIASDLKEGSAILTIDVRQVPNRLIAAGKVSVPSSTASKSVEMGKNETTEHLIWV